MIHKVPSVKKLLHTTILGQHTWHVFCKWSSTVWYLWRNWFSVMCVLFKTVQMVVGKSAVGDHYEPAFFNLIVKITTVTNSDM